MWNNLNLECPTEDLCQYNVVLEGAILQELPTLVRLLKTSSEIFVHDHPIWEEIKVFHNVREQYRRILHSDKCVLLLQRVGTCLQKMVSLNLSKTYLNLAEQFHTKLQSQSSPILLPSCQQLEYVMLRTQSAAKLICEVLRYSKEAFCYIIQRLRMGQLILNLTMATSVSARVNILFRDILVQIFDIYKKLYIWLEKLKKGTTKWPKPLDLPEDLEAWMNPEASDLLKPQDVPKSQVAFLSHFFEKQKNGTKPTESDNVNDYKYAIVGETSPMHLENPDVGEVIPRPKEHKKKIKRELIDTKTVLLGKIQKADSFKKLKTIIWRNQDVGSQVLLRKVLTPRKKKLIKHIILIAKKRVNKIKQLDVSADVKKEQKVAIIQSTGNQLAKHLGLIETESGPSTSSASSSVLSVEELKPVKKLKELRLLYNALYQMLQSTQQYEECAELEKKFKDTRAVIKRLIENDEKKIAKELIVCTSKEFLTRFKE